MKIKSVLREIPSAIYHAKYSLLATLFISAIVSYFFLSPSLLLMIPYLSWIFIFSFYDVYKLAVKFAEIRSLYRLSLTRYEFIEFRPMPSPIQTETYDYARVDEAETRITLVSEDVVMVPRDWDQMLRRNHRFKLRRQTENVDWQKEGF